MLALPSLLLIINIMVLSLIVVVLLVRPKLAHRRLIRKHVETELAGKLSAIYSLGDNAYEVVYFDSNGQKRRAKCLASAVGGVSWTDDDPF